MQHDRKRSLLVATTTLTVDEPEFLDLRPVSSGIVAAPLSAGPAEYIVWFRPERVRTLTWGGDPLKAVIIGEDPSDLSPRRSFAQWHQLVQGTSDPWTPADLATARLIGTTVADVAIQFRSVRMVIAQDQLTTVSRQVHQSDAPIIVADVEGRILLLNEAFEANLKTAHPHLDRLQDLSSHFANPSEFRMNLEALLKTRRSWRGEVAIRNPSGADKALMVRADPVIAQPNRILGFVLMFNDLAERKAAEAARSRFQERINGRRPQMTAKLDSSASVLFQDMMAPTIENAQLAALEITHGAEAVLMPEMLESVGQSTERTLEILRHVVHHTSRKSG
jgi:PAS domain S-box-containing protein